jgi:excisionase family DNA binding protein
MDKFRERLLKRKDISVVLGSLLRYNESVMRKPPRPREQKDLDRVLTVSEAAAEKGVSLSGVRTAIKEGRLRADERSHVYLIHRRDLDDWQPIGHRPKKKQEEKPWDGVRCR